MLKYEISQSKKLNKLKKLQDFKIVFIFDDSDTMNLTLNESPLNNTMPKMLQKVTRWQELIAFANVALNIARYFNDCDGCGNAQGSDVYFLNSPSVKNVKDSQSFINEYLANMKPQGDSSNMDKIFNLVLSENADLVKGTKSAKKLLIIILTDGEKKDAEFKKSLMSRRPINRIYVNIVITTDNKETVSYMNRWDKEILNLDVIDDYNSEKREVKLRKGLQHHFSYGDYVCKCMIGSLDFSTDRMDERYNQECLIC